MESSDPTSLPLNWFGLLSVHQDFFWFVSLLTWCLALILWWRHPERRTSWRWLLPPAGAVIAIAVIQFGIFNPALDLFQSRLTPGTVSDYRPPKIDPYWLGDILIGFAQAAMLAGWGWQGTRGRWGKVNLRWLAPLGALAAGVIHIFNPVAGGFLMAALGLICGALLFRTASPHWRIRLALLGAALIPVISTVGPIAATFDALQRNGPPTIAGLIAGAFQLGLGAGTLGLLAGSAYRSLTPEKKRTLWPDARPFFWTAIVLMVAGVSFGLVTGHDNRHEILENRLRTTAAHAAVFDPTLLAPLTGETFWQLHTPAKEPAFRAGPVPQDGADALRRRLLEVVVATPFLREARITVIRGGWLIAAVSSESGQPVEYLRRATPRDVEHWIHPKPFYEESPVPEIGYDYYSRAPILSADGKMLGWLDAVRSEFYQTVPRRWRAAPFIMTDLGVVLLALIFSQRRSTRDRESALREAAVAAESNRIKTAFFANVSHELRTPLQNILGYSELLQRDSALLPQRGQLAALQEQGELMKRLVNDLIDLSALEAGAFQLSPRAIAPGSVVTITVDSLRPRADAKGLALRSHVDASVSSWVMIDGERLRQVTLNLVNNAVKFTDRGGVTVSLGAPGPDTLELTVSDTGPGIPPAQQTRLFMPFSRLAQTAAKEGSGLGLALSAALCETMGGALRVESDGVNGSRFIATFCAGAALAPDQPRPATEVPPRFFPRILVVDDNTLVRELFTRFLRQQGVCCDNAFSIESALAKAATENFDTVLLDLALPDGSGSSLVAPLRARFPAIRLIGVSAHAGLAEREHALSAGMDAFLVKPVELDLLWRTITTRSATEPSGAEPARPTPVAAGLLELFARELPGKQDELVKAISARDWKRVRACAHYLRNSALVVKAGPLYAACSELENAADEGEESAIHRAWRRCDQILQTHLGSSRQAV